MVTLAFFQALKVPSPGYGAMSLCGAYGPANDDESLKVLARAAELGCTFWDTAVAYGMGSNEELIGKYLSANPGVRDKLFIASKCAFEFDFEAKKPLGVTNKAEHIRSYLADSTRRLGSPPDLYYLHRRDPATSLEESIGTLDGFRRKGNAIAHIDALQIEYSAFCLDNEHNGLIDTARELGVTFVAFSPLGAGFLTGKYKDVASLGDGFRSQSGRFQGEDFKRNLRIVEALEKLAVRKGCTPSQLAIAWVTAQGAVPIPGTRSLQRLEENFGATAVSLSDAELEEIRAIQKEMPTTGSRWPEYITSAMGK